MKCAVCNGPIEAKPVKRMGEFYCSVYCAEVNRERMENLDIFQQSVTDLGIDNGKIQSVTTKIGLTFEASTVVLTVGTFLGGIIHIGETTQQGGRTGDQPSNTLAKKLRSLPFWVDRLKTGTPPRLDAKSLDFDKMQEQPGDRHLLYSLLPHPLISRWLHGRIPPQREKYLNPAASSMDHHTCQS